MHVEKHESRMYKYINGARRRPATCPVASALVVKADGDPATSAVEAKPPSEVDVLVQMAHSLAQYDRMFEMARELKDPRAMMQITQRKDEHMKLHKHIDPAVKQQLDDVQAKTISDRDALRRRMREEDLAAQEVKLKNKKGEERRKAVAAEKKAAKVLVDQLRLELDTMWTEKHFGQGLPEMPNGKCPVFDKSAKTVCDHYREAFNRLRLRSPPLPEHLSVQWDDLLADFPAVWLGAHRARYGNQGGRKFVEKIETLFEVGLFHFHNCSLYIPT